MCLNCEINRRASQDWFVINDVEQEFPEADNVFGVWIQELCLFLKNESNICVESYFDSLGATVVLVAS